MSHLWIERLDHEDVDSLRSDPLGGGAGVQWVGGLPDMHRAPGLTPSPAKTGCGGGSA